MRDYFMKLTGMFKNMHYAHHASPEYNNYMSRIQELRNQFAASAVAA